MLLRFEFLTEKARKKLAGCQNAIPEPLAGMLTELAPILGTFLTQCFGSSRADAVPPIGAKNLRYDGPSDTDLRERMIADLIGAGYEPLVSDQIDGPVRWAPPGSSAGFGLLLCDAWKRWRDVRDSSQGEKV